MILGPAGEVVTNNGYGTAGYAERHYGYLLLDATAERLRVQFVQCVADDGTTEVDNVLFQKDVAPIAQVSGYQRYNAPHAWAATTSPQMQLSRRRRGRR